MFKPGHPIKVKTNQVLVADLKNKCAQLAQSKQSDRFPGSQPVSLLRKHLRKLKSEDFFVCEKTDGVRYLLLICRHEDGKSPMYLISRKFEFYPVKGIAKLFQNAQVLESFNNSLLDGELVVDEIKQPNGEIKHQAMYLAYDVLNIRGSYVGNLALNDRLRIIQGEFVFPIQQLILAYRKEESFEELPFLFGIKQMYRKEDVPFVLDKVLPDLNHENDGLIFTQVNLPVIHGTCEGIMKWKPKRLNSVDFLLEIEWFNIKDIGDSETLFHFDDEQVMNSYKSMKEQQEESFIYNQSFLEEDEEQKLVKKMRYCKLSAAKRGMPLYFCDIYLTQDEHSKLFEEYKGKPVVVECCLNENKPTLDLTDVENWQNSLFTIKPAWSVMRVRDDKTTGNDIRTVQNVIKSIEANITEDELKSLVGKPIKKYSF